MTKAGLISQMSGHTLVNFGYFLFQSNPDLNAFECSDAFFEGAW